MSELKELVTNVWGVSPTRFVLKNTTSKFSVAIDTKVPKKYKAPCEIYCSSIVITDYFRKLMNNGFQFSSFDGVQTDDITFTLSPTCLECDECVEIDANWAHISTKSQSALPQKSFFYCDECESYFCNECFDEGDTDTDTDTESESGSGSETTSSSSNSNAGSSVTVELKDENGEDCDETTEYEPLDPEECEHIYEKIKLPHGYLTRYICDICTNVIIGSGRYSNPDNVSDSPDLCTFCSKTEDGKSIVEKHGLVLTINYISKKDINNTSVGNILDWIPCIRDNNGDYLLVNMNRDSDNYKETAVLLTRNGWTVLFTLWKKARSVLRKLISLETIDKLLNEYEIYDRLGLDNTKVLSLFPKDSPLSLTDLEVIEECTSESKPPAEDISQLLKEVMNNEETFIKKTEETFIKKTEVPPSEKKKKSKKSDRKK